MSPSPSIRGSTRQIKAQSLPLVPSVMQMYNMNNNGGTAQSQGQGQSHSQQGSPTASQQSKRSPPPPKLHSPTVRSAVNGNGEAQNGDRERMTPPPVPPQHALSQPNVHTAPPTLPHTMSQPNIHPYGAHAHPRPINRGPPPQFLSSFQSMEENWQMTMAAFEQEQGPMKEGMGGVAYAGGASSSSLSLANYGRASPAPREVDRVRAGEGLSPREGSLRGQSPRRGSIGSSHSQQQASSSPSGSQKDDRSSPSFHSPLGTPGEYSFPGGYTQAQYRRKPTAVSPDAQSTTAGAKRGTPDRDRSLPVQEEPEDDNQQNVRNSSRERWAMSGSGNGNGNGRNSRNERQEEEEEEEEEDTLIEQDDHDNDRNGDGKLRNGRTRSEDEDSYTPRSPSVSLPPHPAQGVIYGGGNGNVAKHSRMGSTDQLGLRGIDTELFDGKPSHQSQPPPKQQQQQQQQQAKEEVQNHHQRPYVQEPPQGHNSAPPRYTSGAAPPQSFPRLHPPQIPHPEDLQNFFDDPTFIQAYLNSPRPMAPIPPTPHSQTAAPSPSPLISSIQPSPAPPVGSPYPYPFTHVRRTQAYAPSPIGDGSMYDPNHPSAIQEQLAMQMQMYALNNHVPVSESSFSPPPSGGGIAYNPWTYLQSSRMFGGRRDSGLSGMSMRSSPSHEPLILPMPHMRGRGMKKAARKEKVKSEKREKIQAQLPPRVESTQPRETTPEITSGDDTSTAGEDERHELPEEGVWVNTAATGDEGDWVDEDVEGEEDDLLELEYHPSYVSNIEKRRRRWETRWEALIQAVSSSFFPFCLSDSRLTLSIVTFSSKHSTARQMRHSSYSLLPLTPARCTL